MRRDDLRSSRLRRLLPALLALEVAELRELEQWLWERGEELEPWKPPIIKGREVVEEVRGGKITYRLEHVRCGKDACRCTRGKLHGPYWYSYSRDGGRVVSKYVGKKLPKGVKA